MRSLLRLDDMRTRRATTRLTSGSTFTKSAIETGLSRHAVRDCSPARLRLVVAGRVLEPAKRLRDQSGEAVRGAVLQVRADRLDADRHPVSIQPERERRRRLAGQDCQARVD